MDELANLRLKIALFDCDPKDGNQFQSVYQAIVPVEADISEEKIHSIMGAHYKAMREDLKRYLGYEEKV